MGRWLDSLRDEEKKHENAHVANLQNPQNLSDEGFEGFEGGVTGVFAKKNPSGEPGAAAADEARAPLLDPKHLQREADRRNADTVRAHSTDRWCACGQLATFARPTGPGRENWRCLECVPMQGSAI